jgi:hypothetical protein
MPTKLLALVLTTAVWASASACGSSPAAELGRLRDLAKTCPEAKSVSGFVALSGSRNQRMSQLTAARLDAVEIVATKVAVCGGGALKVVAFGPTLASSVTVYEVRLDPAGATLNARLLRVPHLVSNAVDEVKLNLPKSFRRLSSQGTDPLAQLQAAREFIDEQADAVEVGVLIETAGMASQALTNPLTPGAAATLPDRVDLRGARVTFAGLGRVGSGPRPSTATVHALIAFYRRACERTGATCRATTAIAVGS